MNFFFYGTLCHLPLLDVVMGRSHAGVAAVLSDHAVYWARGGAYPSILPAPKAVAEGILLTDVTAAEAERLDFYEGGFGYCPQQMRVRANGGDVLAQVYFPQGAADPSDRPWHLADWEARFGPAAVATAADFMALMGHVAASDVASRYGAMLVRGASSVRAQGPQKASLRRVARPEDISVARRDQPYARFFAVEEWQVGWRQFDGGMNAPVTRAVFVSCDAVTVLPYDPLRDRVLLIEQFRAGPMARGDAGAWQLEAVAGRIDPGETPEEAGRREAVEEAGLTLGRLLPVAEYYPSPGHSDGISLFLCRAGRFARWRGRGLWSGRRGRGYSRPSDHL